MKNHRESLQPGQYDQMLFTREKYIPTPEIAVLNAMLSDHKNERNFSY